MPTDYSDESDFKYIEGLAQIPNPGPDLDVFTPEDKLEAAEIAEGVLEADVNDGSEIDSPSVLHSRAAGAYASYWLFSEAEEPSTALSGQIVEGSTDDAAEFIDRLEDIYNKLVASINASDEDEGDTSRETVSFEVL